MEEISRQIEQDTYGGLKQREARLKKHHDEYLQTLEDAEIRELAISKLILKELREAQTADLSPPQQIEVIDDLHEPESADFIEKEISQIRKETPAEELVSTIADTIQVHYAITPHRDLLVKLRLPKTYPSQALVTELYSPTLHPDVLKKLEASSTAVAEAHLQEGQVLPVLNSLSKFMHGNRLAPAFQDLQQIQAFLKENGGTLQRTNQATGKVEIKLQQQAYSMEFVCIVPELYPAAPLQMHVRSCNLPDEVVQLSFAEARSNAQKLAEPMQITTDVHAAAVRPGAGQSSQCKSAALLRAGKQTITSSQLERDLLASSKERTEQTQQRQEQQRASHVAQPSLYVVVKQLYNDCVHRLGSGKCAICRKRLLPADPALLGKVPKSMQVLRLHCGHMYHRHCVETYVTDPPFGKCCHTCGVFIEHGCLTTDVRVLEARWAAKQAKQRQYDEIADFLK